MFFEDLTLMLQTVLASLDISTRSAKQMSTLQSIELSFSEFDAGYNQARRLIVEATIRTIREDMKTALLFVRDR